MICQAQSKTENRVKRVAVYSDYLALQCGLMEYTIDTTNGRYEKSCLPFLCLQWKFDAFGSVMRFDSVILIKIKRQARIKCVCRFCICRGICRIWLYCAVCGNRRMYAVIRQERESKVANEIFLLLPKCHKWLCYAVCSDLWEKKRQVRRNTALP